MRYIPYIEASEFPEEVITYCIEHEISIHCQNDVAHIPDDGNVFAEWLKSLNVDPLDIGQENTFIIAISAT